jgi:hypothetical protein
MRELWGISWEEKKEEGELKSLESYASLERLMNA